MTSNCDVRRAHTK